MPVLAWPVKEAPAATQRNGVRGIWIDPENGTLTADAIRVEPRHLKAGAWADSYDRRHPFRLRVTRQQYDWHGAGSRFGRPIRLDGGWPSRRRR
jgi:hypothetical protein